MYKKPPPKSRAKSNQSLKGYSELLRLAVGLRVDAALVVWLALRKVDGQGRGWLTLDAALWAVLSDSYGLGAKPTLYKNLRQGDGLLWTRHGGRVFIHSLARVTRRLIALAEDTRPGLLTASQQTNATAGHPVALPYPLYTPSHAGRRYSSRRALFFAAWLGAQRGATRVASLASLASLWAVSKDTVRRWAEWPTLTVTATWQHAPLWAESMVPDHAREIDTPHGPRWTWRGPNCYQAPPSRLDCRGMAGHLNSREVKQGRPAVIYADGHVTQSPVRLFWDDEKPATKDKRRPADQQYYVRADGPRPGWRGRWYRWCCDLPRPVVRAEWELRRGLWADLGLTNA